MAIARSKRVVENGRHVIRWTIQGHKGLFVFRVMAGVRQSIMDGEVLAKFSSIDGSRYIEAYFRPVSLPVPIFVSSFRYNGKPYFCIQCPCRSHHIQGGRWTEKVEQKARKICKNRHMPNVVFYDSPRR
jgi:hypothetical protein